MSKAAIAGVPGPGCTPHTLWCGVPPTAEREPLRPKGPPAAHIDRNWGGFGAGIPTDHAGSISGALRG